MKDEMNFSEMLFNRDEQLLDYITNLQEENEKLKEDRKKVLDLIENDYFEDGSFKNYYKVINILKGDDEE